jgi:hypothetical protein
MQHLLLTAGQIAVRVPPPRRYRIACDLLSARRVERGDAKLVDQRWDITLPHRAIRDTMGNENGFVVYPAS